MSEYKTLLELLHSSFPTEPIPVDLFCKLEHIQDNDFREEFRCNIGQRRWTEVSLNDWLMMGFPPVTIRPYIWPSVFIYYLPSLLIGVLDDVGYMDYVLEAIIPSGRARRPKGEWWIDFSNKLSSQQRVALSVFLATVRRALWDSIGESSRFLIYDAEAIWSL